MTHLLSHYEVVRQMIDPNPYMYVQVPLGIILMNENKLAEMADILKHLQVQQTEHVYNISLHHMYIAFNTMGWHSIFLLEVCASIPV